MTSSPLTRVLLVAILFTAMATAGASAQNRPQTGAQEAAEAVARGLFLALQETRWDDATALVHPDVLRSVREETLEGARWHTEQADSDSTSTVHPKDPDMPEAVAEWFEAQAREYEAQYESHLEQVYGVRSVEALDTLSPHDLFAKVLAASDPVAMMRLFTPEEDWPLLEDPSVAASFRPSRHVLGSIMEGDSVAYVVYSVRHGLRAPDDRGLAVLPIARTEDGWRARLDPSDLLRAGPMGGPMSVRAVDDEAKP